MIGIPVDVNCPHYQWVNEKLIILIKVDRTVPIIWITFVDGSDIAFKFESKEDQHSMVKKLTQESRI